MLDWLPGRGGDDEKDPDEEDRPDEYALIRTAPDKTKVRSYSDRVQPSAVRLEEPDLPAGSYQLQGMSGGRFGSIEWQIEIGDWGADNDSTERVEREVRQLRRELRNQDSQNERPPAAGFSDPMERLAFQIVEQAVQSEKIMAAKGDEILDRALDQAFSSDEPSVDYEIDGELQATLHELRKNPERATEYVSLASELSQSLGKSFAEGMAGAAGGGGAGGVADALDKSAPSSDTPTGVEATEPGPATLDGLDLDAAVDTGVESAHTESDGHPSPEAIAEADTDPREIEEELEPTERSVDRAGLNRPATPTELREMPWNALQKLASEEGLNSSKMGGKQAVISELETILFDAPPDDSDDLLSGGSDDSAAESESTDDSESTETDDAASDSEEEGIEIQSDTSPSGEGADPEQIAKNL